MPGTQPGPPPSQLSPASWWGRWRGREWPLPPGAWPREEADPVLALAWGPVCCRSRGEAATGPAACGQCAEGEGRPVPPAGGGKKVCAAHTWAPAGCSFWALLARARQSPGPGPLPHPGCIPQTSVMSLEARPSPAEWDDGPHLCRLEGSALCGSPHSRPLLSIPTGGGGLAGLGVLPCPGPAHTCGVPLRAMCCPQVVCAWRPWLREAVMKGPSRPLASRCQPHAECFPCSQVSLSPAMSPGGRCCSHATDENTEAQSR